MSNTTYADLPTRQDPEAAMAKLLLAIIAYFRTHRDSRMPETVQHLILNCVDALRTRDTAVIRSVLAVAIIHLAQLEDVASAPAVKSVLEACSSTLEGGDA